MFVKATAAALPQLQALSVFMTLVVWWALMRPSMIRDYDNRRLPHNSTARFLFVIFCLLAYIALVVFFHAFGQAAQDVARLALPPLAHNLVDTFKNTETLLAFVTMSAMLQFSFVRDLERSLLVWLHSARHLHGDSESLAKHLERCKFEPGEDEKEAHRDCVRKFGVYVTDSGFNSVGLTTFHSWRKVSTLLRLLREWNAQDSRVLAQNDLGELAKIETAHERKTHLAMTIVKLVDQAENGGIGSAGLAAVMALLANTSHANRDGVTDVETRVKSALDTGNAGVSERPLRLSSEAFKAHVQQIEGYFKVEYDLLLSQVAAFTAKSVVLSGTHAPERLEQLRGLGFGGLGRIEVINFDRILWLFMVVACGGFLVMFLGNMGNPNTSADRLARFAFVMAVAALIGAMVGSHQRNGRAISTPWGLYLGAGLLAAFIHLAVNEIWELARGYMQQAYPADMSVTPAGTVSAAAPPMRAINLAPWTLLPCMVTIAVCRMGRLPRLPWLRGPQTWRGLTERAIDGFAISGAVLLGFYLAIGAHFLFGIPLPKSVEQLLAQGSYFKFPIMMPLQTMGFLIGFFAVRDVRNAAHANILDPRAPALAAGAGALSATATAAVAPRSEPAVGGPAMIAAPPRA